MTDLIDRAALLKEIWSIGNQPWSEWETAGVVNLVCRQPPVDAVPVVRCKDCKHYENHKLKVFENCVRNERFIPMKPNDFCSYGERRTDADN